MSQQFFNHQWSILCQSAQDNASRLASGASATASELIHRESGRFCRLDPPSSKEALNSAYTRRMALSARLTAITRADAVANAHPAAAENVFDEVRKFCDADLASTSEDFLEMQVANLKLTSQICSICEAKFSSHPL